MERVDDTTGTNDDEKVMEEDESSDQEDLLLLEESDIPRASWNGKQPCQLNVTELKRWLACRGAPVTGKKPELIERWWVIFV